jgi:hypothetical protein
LLVRSRGSSSLSEWWAGCGLTTLILLLLASIAESLHKLAEKGDATG